jgi:O-antigen/teichoic acid export membrane protein
VFVGIGRFTRCSLTAARVHLGPVCNHTLLFCRGDMPPRRGWAERTVFGLSTAALLAAGRRVGWGLLDQALSSLTNFALGVVIAREVNQTAFGAFGIAFATYLIVLGISRALGSEPLVIRYTRAPDENWRRAAGRASGMAVVVGLVTGTLCVTAGVIADDSLRSALIALGVVLPGLLVQDVWRFALFAAGRGSGALLNDLAWAVVLFPTLALLIAAGQSSVGWFILAWGGAAAVAAAVGAWQTGTLPRPAGARSWFREHRELAPRFLGEFGAFNASTQLTIYGVGAVVGLASVGSLRAADLLLGPLTVLFLGINLVAVPEGVRALAVSPLALRRVCLLFSFLVATAALTFGTVIHFLPPNIGTALLGESWDGAHQVIFLLALSRAGTGFAAGATAGLRSLGAAKRSLKARLLCVPLVIVGGIGGAAIAGVRGAAAGLALSSCMEASIWWWQLRHGLTDHKEKELDPVRGAEGPQPQSLIREAKP